MPKYLLYRDDLETIELDEKQTHDKIIDLMAEGMHLVREKYGRSVRISHAKAHGELKGELTVYDNLPTELAQGMFAKPGSYAVLVRMAQAPGEFVDDSKVSTDRGMSVKVLGIRGPKLDAHAADVQDWVFDVGTQFINGGAKAFLQSFKANAELAPKLSDDVKGAVSKVAAAANSALNAFGANSEKLAFFGHPQEHPLATAYFSQTAYRYGDFVAKLGFFPVSQDVELLKSTPFEANGPDALRNAMITYFKTHPAVFEMRVQLSVGLEAMPIEDAQAEWSQALSPYQAVARLELPIQTAWDPERDRYFENLSFSPAHALVAHRPLGSINRARLAAYRALAARRLQDNQQTEEQPTLSDQVPD